ncbi:unnamed protein product [Rotaria sordida]|uniref:LisH domain-containing protein n=1 Tax=Rotaria sordida TaxID=392033 RepID=A0A814AF88_9BILA|nr:unnamed protein product [Rotaria sordida]CAF3519981.1 unnamed protein product [Rotaria sordida]
MAEATLNYQTIRTTHAAREADDLRVENRKKNLIILVLQWLAEEGYVESARQLEHETNLDVNKYDVCDNIDLDTILQEYESYFFIKFNKYPKLTKRNGPAAPFASKISSKLTSTQPSARRSNVPSLPRVTNNGTDATVTTTTTTTSAGQIVRPPSAGDALRKLSFTRKLNRSNSEKINAHLSPSSGLQQTSSQQLGNTNGNHSTNSLEEMSLSFMKVSSVKTVTSSNEQQQQQQQQQQQNGNKKKFPNTIIDCRAILNDALRVPVEDNVDPADRLLKPLGGFVGYNSEWRELAEVVSRVQEEKIYKEKKKIFIWKREQNRRFLCMFLVSHHHSSYQVRHIER